MSTQYETNDTRNRSTIYIVVAVVVVVLIVLGSILWAARNNNQSSQKADQLISAIEKTGATAPSKDQIENVLGADGGAACEDPASALKKATLLSLLTTGSSGPGMRPILADGRVVKGQLLIVSIYCPDKLPKLKDFIDNLDFKSVAGG